MIYIQQIIQWLAGYDKYSAEFRTTIIMRIIRAAETLPSGNIAMKKRDLYDIAREEGMIDVWINWKHLVPFSRK